MVILASFEASAQERIRDWSGISGSQSYDDQFGTMVASAGDVDGDGMADALITAPYEDPTLNVEVGAVYLLSSASGAVLQHVLGAGDRQSFGWTLCAPGDLDGDGVADFVVGSPDWVHASSPGRAFAFAGATGNLMFTKRGPWRGSSFGEDLSSVGDVDADGVGDFSVGDDPGGYGDVYIYSGRTRSVLSQFQGSSATSNMAGAMGVGDLDGDGHDDFGICAPGDGANGEGMFTVYSGASGNVIYALQGEQSQSRFGYPVRKLGDVDGDGFDDLGIVAMLYDGAFQDQGRINVYSGRSGTLLWEFDGAMAGERINRLPTNGAVDFNHDGFADIAIGSIPRNLVHVYSGRTGTLLYDIRGGVENGLPDLFGATMAGMGDLNGDGIDDILVGAPGNSRYWAAAGRAYVFSGNDLFLQANQPSYQPYETFDLENRGGVPGAPTCIVLTAVNSTPMFLPLAFGALDNEGSFALTGSVPPGLSGITLTFLGYAIGANGHRIVDSIPETVAFQ